MYRVRGPHKMDATSKIEQSERVKYEGCWGHPSYRLSCHALQLYQERPELFSPSPINVLDIGCGTGRFLAYMNEKGVDAWGVDIAPNCLDPEVAAAWGSQVTISTIWDMELPVTQFDLGVCTDVMEHIPPEYVIPTLRSIADYCRKVVFKIAHVPSVMIRTDLHLTLEPPRWWANTMRGVSGRVEDAGIQLRAGYQDSLFVWYP